MATSKEQAFYQELSNMFMTPGWAHLKQGWEQEQKQLPEIVFFNAKSQADIDIARVRYGLLDELIKLPETIEQQRQAQEQSESQDNG